MMRIILLYDDDFKVQIERVENVHYTYQLEAMYGYSLIINPSPWSHQEQHRVIAHYLRLEVLSMFGHQLALDPFISRVSSRTDIVHLGWYFVATFFRQCRTSSGKLLKRIYHRATICLG